MSKVDDTFTFVPGLISEWGIGAEFIKSSVQATYDPATGTVTSNKTSIPVKVVLLPSQRNELEGFSQETEYRIWIDALQIGERLVEIGDQFKFKDSTMGVTEVETYQGDNPIAFSVKAKPQ